MGLGDGAGGRRPGALAGLFVGAALGVAVFLLAAFVYERFRPGRGGAAHPPGFVTGGDARGGVRILEIGRASCRERVYVLV